jgi:hypothetical protein
MIHRPYHLRPLIYRRGGQWVVRAGARDRPGETTAAKSFVKRLNQKSSATRR